MYAHANLQAGLRSRDEHGKRVGTSSRRTIVPAGHPIPTEKVAKDYDAKAKKAEAVIRVGAGIVLLAVGFYLLSSF